VDLRLIQCRDFGSVRAAGISISQNLAVIVGIGLGQPWESSCTPFVLHVGKEMAVRIYTRDDGSAFKGCPYFKYWKSTGELYTHDESVEDLTFSRVISDFCRVYQCNTVGYNPEEVPTIVNNSEIRTYAVPRDQYEQEFVDDLSKQADRSESRSLFPMNSCMEFMWGNLPLVGGKRTLPSQENPPYGRWDGIRALLSAEKARSVMQAEVWEEEKKQAPVLQIAGSQVSEHLRRLHAPPPPTKYIWIKHPFDGYRKLAYWELKSVRDLFIRDPRFRAKFLFITDAEEALPWRDQTAEELALAAEIEAEIRRPKSGEIIRPWSSV
jgi:hypothetical protein